VRLCRLVVGCPAARVLTVSLLRFLPTWLPFSHLSSPGCLLGFSLHPAGLNGQDAPFCYHAGIWRYDTDAGAWQSLARCVLVSRTRHTDGALTRDGLADCLTPVTFCLLRGILHLSAPLPLTRVHRCASPFLPAGLSNKTFCLLYRGLSPVAHRILDNGRQRRVLFVRYLQGTNAPIQNGTLRVRRLVRATLL